MKGELPRWIPFMTKGTVANVWFLLQNGLLNNLFYPLAPFLKSANYYYLFYLSLLFDEIILVTGTILLARLLYQNNWAVFFVTTAVIGTTNWTTQVWWNFHLYYLFPLVAYFYIKAVSEKSFLYFFLGNLFVLLWSFYGNLTYYIPLITFVIFLVGFLYSAVAVSFKALKWDRAAADSETSDKKPPQILSLEQCRRNLNVKALFKISSMLILSLIPFVIIHQFLTRMGTSDIVYGIGREKSGAVSLASFLTYGELTTGYAKFIELLSGIPESLDVTLFSGIFTMSLCLSGIFFLFRREALNKYALALFLTILCIVSFSTGGIVAKLAYHWPFMDKYRHIVQASALIKICIIFFAGFTVNRLVNLIHEEKGRELSSAIKVISLFLLFFLIFKLSCLFFPDAMAALSSISLTKDVGPFEILSVLLPAIFLFTYAWIMLRAPQNVRLLGLAFVLLMIFSITELFMYRFSMYNTTLIKQNTPEAISLFSFSNYEYPEYRSQKYDESKRFLVLNSVEPFLFVRGPNIVTNKRGMQYWSNDAFFFFDPCGTIFRSDHRLKNVDDYFRLYGDQHEKFNIEQPLPDHTGFQKMMGCYYPKLQLFKNIYHADNIDDQLKSPQYKGDILLTDDRDNRDVFEDIKRDDDKSILKTDTRIRDIPIFVRHFGANHINIELQNDRHTPLVLHYADAYHPYWKAMVNGKEEKIYRSNKAFKAVIIPSGNVQIDFRFKENKVTLAMYFIIMVGLIGVAVVVYHLFLLIKNEKGQASEEKLDTRKEAKLKTRKLKRTT